MDFHPGFHSLIKQSIPHKSLLQCQIQNAKKEKGIVKGMTSKLGGGENFLGVAQ